MKKNCKDIIDRVNYKFCKKCDTELFMETVCIACEFLIKKKYNDDYLVSSTNFTITNNEKL